MKIGAIKVIVGILGILGIMMCGSSVIAWTLMLGSPQNYIGVVLVALLCGCAALCCLNLINEGRNG